MEYARTYYVRPDGTQTHEYANFKPVLKLLKDMYGDKRVSEFGPLALKAIRERMIRDGRARTYINKQSIRIRLIPLGCRGGIDIRSFSLRACCAMA